MVAVLLSSLGDQLVKHLLGSQVMSSAASYLYFREQLTIAFFLALLLNELLKDAKKDGKRDATENVI